MNKSISVFEFDYLVRKSEYQNQEYNVKVISDTAFEYLKRLCLSDGNERQLLKLRTVHRCEALQVQNYAGVIFTPDKTQIEVLPKIGRQWDSKLLARESLFMMLKSLKGFRHIETLEAHVANQKMPLLEVFIAQFLSSVNTLVKRGLRSDYIAQEKNLAYMKGKLNVGKQVRHNLINKHKFYVEYDEFLQDRPASRLLHSALLIVESYSRSSSNQKLLRELLFFFSNIPQSSDYKLDFDRLKLDRGMSYYQNSLAWARLILDGISPYSMIGEHYAPSLLFPMESLFESFVAKILYKQISSDYQVNVQAQSQTLVKHGQQNWFRLKPDLLIEKNSSIKAVLDTKWKLIDQTKDNSLDKYGLSQSDFYQMFAYGHKYLNGKGDLFLLYPRSEKFKEAIKSSFCFNPDSENKLNLWVVPVDLLPNIVESARIKWPEGSNLFR